MRLLAPPPGVMSRRVDTKAQLDEASAACDAVLDINSDAEAIREYHLMSITASRARRLAVRIFAQGTGIEPEACFFGNIALVGYDCGYFGVHLNDERVSYSGSLEGPFFQLLPVNDELVLLIHEIGVAALQPLTGALKWKVHTDIIREVHLGGDRLTIVPLEGLPKFVSIATGSTC